MVDDKPSVEMEAKSRRTSDADVAAALPTQSPMLPIDSCREETTSTIATTSMESDSRRSVSLSSSPNHKTTHLRFRSSSELLTHPSSDTVKSEKDKDKDKDKESIIESNAYGHVGHKTSLSQTSSHSGEMDIAEIRQPDVKTISLPSHSRLSLAALLSNTGFISPYRFSIT